LVHFNRIISMLAHPCKESDIYSFFSQNEASLFKTKKDASEVD
jgi:hypothetical protein